MGEEPSVMARIGVSTICRTLEMIVMTETYRSPPVWARTLLQQMETRLLVSCITKPEVPRLTIFLAYCQEPGSSLCCSRRTRISAFFIRKYNTNPAERHCEITVAMAAPLMPRCNAKIKIGSKMRLATAPMVMESIPVVA